jgi:hypothetical protein
MIKLEIRFDKKRYQSLRRAYGQATMRGLEVFEWNGHEFVTNYAKYLLEYLKPKFEEPNDV